MYVSYHKERNFQGYKEGTFNISLQFVQILKYFKKTDSQWLLHLMR